MKIIIIIIAVLILFGCKPRTVNSNGFKSYSDIDSRVYRDTNHLIRSQLKLLGCRGKSTVDKTGRVENKNEIHKHFQHVELWVVSACKKQYKFHMAYYQEGGKYSSLHIKDYPEALKNPNEKTN